MIGVVGVNISLLTISKGVSTHVWLTAYKHDQCLSERVLIIAPPHPPIAIMSCVDVKAERMQRPDNQHSHAENVVVLVRGHQSHANACNMGRPVGGWVVWWGITILLYMGGPVRAAQLLKCHKTCA